ncbi:GTA baseplate fiber-binding domain-containing protein [Croceicoccus naphthovorans]|uniref:Uncharacterized protein n=1 Tax=Croceicoccus naphthovorans TaxID=1348774 RepID=A0A0G3XFW8_9SPHN|nr:phage tail protein [Croceicoccus naphthovorans]AKM09278.1 hypothetical protein AB433_03665 [Croceicoccus naphthovorans]MBB3990177.1 hypothetical protein [Croceicoccus naphthovorans]
MATLVLSAVGTALGGPLGGALGSFAGRMIDGKIIGTPSQKGPRLKELDVTTSSYGTPLPRHYGQVRSAGSVIWATDLKEHKKKSGGGKGKPKVTTYTYSMSFAVALASRPIQGIGRIWADGNLLMGSEGDLKAGGKYRLYTGTEDQRPDRLIASDIGPSAPAFRGIAYIVFESLQLADFGNRIPALTFEIFADESQPRLVDILDMVPDVATGMELDGLLGFTHDAGSQIDVLAIIDEAYPMACDGSTGNLSITAGQPASGMPVTDLPPAVTGTDGEFARMIGTSRSRSAGEKSATVSLRYYDLDRDYQPGLQRSRARPGPGSVDGVEFPASLRASDARLLAEKIATRRESNRDTLSYRVASLSRRYRPGALVRPAGERGVFQVRSWEWRAKGVELELQAISPSLSIGLASPGDPGTANPPVDRQNGPTIIKAFELPWDGIGSGNERLIYAAASSAADGWDGASLYVDRGDGMLIDAGVADRDRATIGTAASTLPPASPHVVDRSSTVIVQLANASDALLPTDVNGLLQGANQARLGSEIIQFTEAKALGGGRWQLSGLLRGRGGTEFAIGLHGIGESFTLLDEQLTPIDIAAIGNATKPSIVALGNADIDPAVAILEDVGASLRPLTPVCAKVAHDQNGALDIQWIRRARGAWLWAEGVDAPLVEPAETYEVRFIDASGDQTIWNVNSAKLTISPAQWASLTMRPGPARFEIRQIGSGAVSLPLSLPIQDILE